MKSCESCSVLRERQSCFVQKATHADDANRRAGNLKTEYWAPEGRKVTRCCLDLWRENKQRMRKTPQVWLECISKPFNHVASNPPKTVWRQVPIWVAWNGLTIPARQKPPPTTENFKAEKDTPTGRLDNLYKKLQ
eukprot:2598309-Amphidinium_carterae.1